MNILPLIYGFLILLSIGTYAFVHHLKTVLQENVHFTGAMAIERTFADALQNNAYRSQKGENLDSYRRVANKMKETEFHSPRDKLTSKTYRKLNIKSLLSGQGNAAVEKIALSLLQKMYGSSSLYTPGMEFGILDTLVRNLKQHPEITTFETLLPKLTTENYPLFYKLIKGTQSYNLETGAGYPALGDFLTFEPSAHKKPIHFGMASRQVLEALFGIEVTEQIIAQEQRKWEIDHKHNALSKKELEAFFGQHKMNMIDFEPMLEFTNPNRRRTQEIIADDKTNLQIRINS